MYICENTCTLTRIHTHAYTQALRQDANESMMEKEDIIRRTEDDLNRTRNTLDGRDVCVCVCVCVCVLERVSMCVCVCVCVCVDVDVSAIPLLYMFIRTHTHTVQRWRSCKAERSRLARMFSTAQTAN
jgi:hypothetical protein